MPNFEFTGGDPIDHHVLGRIKPGDVVELDDEDPPGPWKATKKKPRRAQDAEQTSTEHGSDESEES
jgi:hypothetical protein